MKSDFETLQARKDLDTYLQKLRRISRKQPPLAWIKEIREALGMTSMQFARRLGTSQPSVASLERSERLETIKIATLRKAAEALDCKLVYALVPSMSLANVLQRKRRRLAERDLRATVPDFSRLSIVTQSLNIDKAAKRIPDKRVWNDEEAKPLPMSDAEQGSDIREDKKKKSDDEYVVQRLIGELDKCFSPKTDETDSGDDSELHGKRD